MVFILVDRAAPTREFVVKNKEWRDIVAVIMTAGILPSDVAELACYHLCTPISSNDAHRIAALLGAQQSWKTLTRTMNQDDLERLVVFLRQSGGIEIC